MESREQQGHSVQIEMEKLNGGKAAEPVPSHSILCLKRGIVLVSVLLLAVSITCLLLIFVFRPVCEQDKATPSAPPPPPTTTGKIYLTYRLQASKQKEPYDIFRVKKLGEYMIHGWLNCSTDVREGVFLHYIDNRTKRVIKPNNKSEYMLFFNTTVRLHAGSRIILSGSQLTDGFFYLHEL